MSRINTNVNSLLAQRILGQQNDALSKSLERLGTGLRINRGSDDPAGLIASEKLRSEKAAISAGISNAERADQIVNVAEGGLQEINNLLIEVQSLVNQTANDAGLSTAEKEANQLQVDAILQTIDRIASTTTFQGTKLLNGAFDFTVSAQIAQVVDFQVNGAKLGNSNLAIEATITQSAQHAGLFMSLDTGTLDLSTSNPSFVFELAGIDGNRQFSFSSGTVNSTIATQINTFKETTGISATASSTGIVFKSIGFGSNEFVSIDIVSHGDQTGAIHLLSANNEDEALTAAASLTDLSAVIEAVRDTGQNVGAIVNGVTARGDGIDFSVNTDGLAVDVTLNSAGYQALGSLSLFTITGGGATFNLGASVDQNNKVTLGIGNVASRNLGTSELTNNDDDTKARFTTLRLSLDDLGGSGQLNLVDGNLTGAQSVINKAVDQISSLRGRLGSFQSNVIGTTISSLGVALENISAAESAIRDTDFAAETASLTRAQILVAAATSVLAITKSQPQQVLSLLG